MPLPDSQKRRSPHGAGHEAKRLGGRVDYKAIALGCASRKLPPFAREVIAAIAAGRSPNVYAFTGPRAWERAQRRRTEHGVGSALVIPNDAEPGSFNWTFLRGLAVVLHADLISPNNRPALIALAAELVAAGVRFVAASDGVSTFAARGCSS
jgi:hypothetical protein